jgi:hypothetical protein
VRRKAWGMVRKEERCGYKLESNDPPYTAELRDNTARPVGFGDASATSPDRLLSSIWHDPVIHVTFHACTRM